jgi:glycine/D-amino acid oxidase-like deaminating enzyme
MIYDHIIVGSGIAGSCLAYQLSQKSPSSKILIIDKNSKIADGASGAAGAFLSPLLGKPNEFKSLVNEALRYSVEFYKINFSNLFSQNGVLRIPKDSKDDEDRKKFESYKPYMEFDYHEKSIFGQDGYFFDIGSLISSQEVATMMIEASQNVEFKGNTNISNIEYKDDIWILNDNLKTQNLILATGAYNELLNNILGEDYIKIKPVWGQRVILSTSSSVPYNLHKDHSISMTKKADNQNINIVSIGATHHRDIIKDGICDEDTKYLIRYANEEFGLQNLNFIEAKAGARASSYDYMPIIGKIIDSKKTVVKYPYLKKGSKVPNKDFIRYENLFVMNGVGGRGFVLSPYLADILSDEILKNDNLNTKRAQMLACDRLFVKQIRKLG